MEGEFNFDIYSKEIPVPPLPENFLDFIDGPKRIESSKKHTQETAKKLIEFLKSKNIAATIIGSLGEGRESDHDIDVLIPGKELKYNIIGYLISILNCSRYVSTDRGGIFLYDTQFGNIDFFFKMPSKDAIES